MLRSGPCDSVKVEDTMMSYNEPYFSDTNKALLLLKENLSSLGLRDCSLNNLFSTCLIFACFFPCNRQGVRRMRHIATIDCKPDVKKFWKPIFFTEKRDALIALMTDPCQAVLFHEVAFWSGGDDMMHKTAARVLAMIPRCSLCWLANSLIPVLMEHVPQEDWMEFAPRSISLCFDFAAPSQWSREDHLRFNIEFRDDAKTYLLIHKRHNIPKDIINCMFQSWIGLSGYSPSWTYGNILHLFQRLSIAHTELDFKLTCLFTYLCKIWESTPLPDGFLNQIYDQFQSCFASQEQVEKCINNHQNGEEGLECTCFKEDVSSEYS